ncbi:MAG: hypothetical protein GXP63_00525 [DPANN group archaeon]|nr:hypothetical protein [DPANN group archaeon]
MPVDEPESTSLQRKDQMHCTLLSYAITADLMNDQAIPWERRLTGYQSLVKAITPEFVKEVMAFDDEYFNRTLAEMFNRGSAAEASSFGFIHSNDTLRHLRDGLPIIYFSNFDARYQQKHHYDGSLKRPVYPGITPVAKMGIERLLPPSARE